MIKRFILMAYLLLAFCTAAWADGDHDDISPEIYATQEAKASANNYGQFLCHVRGYTCKAIDKEESWLQLWPDFQERDKIMRLNRTNVALMYRNWVVVPTSDKDKAPYLSLSPLPQKVNTHGKKLILVDLGLFAFGAYDDNGNLVYWGPVSSGASKCEDLDQSCATITGHFKVYRTRGADCTSGEFPLETSGGAPMPYCMYFHKGYAIHGSTLSGFINRSSGCVRLFYDDAKWLYEQFAKVGTNVIVRDSSHHELAGNEHVGHSA